jgi:endonuclease/exonuclease/phosphatase family metal-dependent hydrolase
MPTLNVGDHYSAPIVGPLDYNFGNWFVEVTQPVTRVDGGLQREVAADVGESQLAVATFNFENLDPTDPQSKFDQLASIFVHNLKSPDIVAGEEVQDNNGPTNNGVVDASQTMNQLIAAIESAGGPHYEWRAIDPVNNQDGGEPGGNIRQVFLYRTDRGLSFVDRAGGTSTNSTAVTGTGAATQLTFSPGRIDPTNSAWNASRKPLAGEFMFRGEHLFVIANHFNSKGGDQAVYGHFQPPTRSSEVQRHQQAQLVADFVSQLTTADPNANVIVAGDLNDFQFSQTLQILKDKGLHDLIETLPLNEQYSYVFEGNSQVLDHIMFSNALFNHQFVYEPVHVNAEFADQASDHDPSVVRITLNQPPTVDGNGPYTVAEGGSVGLSASGNDPEGGALTYAWDLDNNGTYETAGQTPTFSAGTLDGPSSRTVGVRVTDVGGLTATDTATVNITNTPPTATLAAPATTFAGFPFTLSLTSPSDPSAADTAAGFQYAFDCGSGYGSFGTASTASCPTTDVGTRNVAAKIRDKDGGVTEYTASVAVIVTADSLCALVRAYASDPKVADDLCAKLDQIEAAPSGTPRDGLLGAFRNQVDAKVGKGLTAEQAAELKLLSTRL